MPSSMPMQMPGDQMGMQGGMSQMILQMQQGHFMGMNPMRLVSAPPNGMQNTQSPSGNQMYPSSAVFNRRQSGPMPPMPGLNPFQPENTGVSGMGTMPPDFLQSSMPPLPLPLPPSPPRPHRKIML